MLKKFKMNYSNLVGMPMECGIKLSKHEEGNKVDPTLYKILVGSMRYLSSQPETVLDCQVIQKGKYHPKSEILGKWKGAQKKMQPGRMNGALQSPIPILSLWTRIFNGGGLLRALGKTKSSQT